MEQGSTKLMNKLISIIQLLKIKHYVKNIVVLIPLIFSLKFMDFNATLQTLWTFIAFCLISSAVYIFNDILDVENDKNHPIKKYRPIASGLISPKSAWCLFVLLTLFSFTISITINMFVFYSVLLYLTLNILYTLQLKFLPIIDVACIALGFIFRILAGCGAILVKPSPLVILLTFFTSMFFTFSKRKLEYIVIKDKNTLRKSIIEYNKSLLNQFVAINATLSIAFYFTYMLDATTIEKSGTEYLYLTTIPFSLIIFRLLLKIYTCTDNDDPAEFIYKDKTLHIIMFIYVIILLLILKFAS